MTLVDGHVEFAGWTIHLQAQIKADPYGYDQPLARYNDPAITYDDGSMERMWQTIDCQLLRVTCEHGGELDQIPGVRARLGRLRASLYDPDRILDPAASPFALLTKPGVGVRVTATSPTGQRVPLWTGIAERWEHDLLDGTGELEASDLIALLSGVDLADWSRPPESSYSRLWAVVGMMPTPIPFQFSGAASSLSEAKFSGALTGAVVSTGEAEQSMVWVDQLGRLRRADTSGLGSPVLARDCDDGVVPIVYTKLTSLIDDEILTNMVKCDRLNLTEAERSRDPRIYSHADSLRIHGPHTLTETRLPLSNDAALANWAARVLDLRASPTSAIDGLEVTITDAFPWVDRTVPAIVGLSVASVLDVRLTSRGEAERWAVAVASIAHTVTPNEWVVDIGVVDGPAIAANFGYDHQFSIYDRTIYSRNPGIGPYSPARIADAITRVLDAQEVPA